MELTKEQKYRAYRSVGLQFEKARIEKGWTLEEAEKQSGEPLKFLLKLEYGLDSVHKLRFGNLLKLAAIYDCLLKVDFVSQTEDKKSPQ